MKKLKEFYEAHHGKVSDKWTSYLEAYDDLFFAYTDKPVRILEIGIQNGGSLELWSKYFPKAELIVGCDINPLCSKLTYEDPRIHVIVGDANENGTFDRVMALSDQYDIIIDDGSHVSKDIVRSFAVYFPHLSKGGLFVAEDLHCSYWDAFEGGLEAPYSSLSFFKRLTDYVNRDHWGGDISMVEGLSFFSEFYGASFDASSLEKIKEVRFRNSLAAVFSGSSEESLLGKRVVVGEIADVEKAVVGIAGTENRKRDETNNVFGPFSERSEASVFARKDDVKALERINEIMLKMEDLELSLQRTEHALTRARKNPLEPLSQRIAFFVLSGAKKIWPRFLSSGDQWMSRRLEKLDAKRSYRHVK